MIRGVFVDHAPLYGGERRGSINDVVNGYGIGAEGLELGLVAVDQGVAPGREGSEQGEILGVEVAR